VNRPADWFFRIATDADVGRTLGTPKNLREAIKRGRKYGKIEVAVRDFLAQRFTEAMHEHDEEAEVLHLLFKRCVNEDHE
jgi:hypothetical protein